MSLPKTEDELAELRDLSYMAGQRMGVQSILLACVQQLSPQEDVSKEYLLLERTETIAALRQICEDHGDNEWDDNLHMADIINKHLVPYLEEPE